MQSLKKVNFWNIGAGFLNSW